MKNNRTPLILFILFFMVVAIIMVTSQVNNLERKNEQLQQQVDELDQITPSNMYDYLDNNVLSLILLIQEIDAQIQLMDEYHVVTEEDQWRYDVLLRVRQDYQEAYEYWVNYNIENGN